MRTGQPIGRACENIFAHGRNWAGFSNGQSFWAGPDSPITCKTCIRAGWAAHFLMGFAYQSTNTLTQKYSSDPIQDLRLGKLFITFPSSLFP